MNGRVSVIVTTYNQPAWLERSLWAFAVQSDRSFELVVADDGSGEETRSVIERFEEESGLPVLHVWHADRGFRKTEILNRAIVACAGEYLIFTDGDCVPRADFVETHRRLAEPGRFLSGGYLQLPLEVSTQVTVEAIRDGSAFQRRWLQERGWRPGRRALRLVGPGPARILDRLTPTGPTWNGHNASTWRDAVYEVNGYDGDMGYGGLDRALGERLENLGLRGKQVRFQTPVLHLYHGRPYRDRAVVENNRAMRARIRSEKLIRAKAGIRELPPD